MIRENEINALIALLDDNDPEVLDHVAHKLFSLGPIVIDKLENAYTQSPLELVQQRIENIIHKIQFDRVENDLLHWAQVESDDLLKGILIVTRHRYADADEDKIIKTINRIKKEIWQGLNNYLSPLEQIKVLNQTLFSQYQFKGVQVQENDVRYSYLNNIIDTHKGNHFTLGLLYLTLCQQLEIPMYGVCLSTHFILARTKDYITDFDDNDHLKHSILFYINPFNRGLAFSDREINSYLKKLNINVSEKYYLPASNKVILKEYIQYLTHLYKKPEDNWVIKDLYRLSDVIDEEN